MHTPCFEILCMLSNGFRFAEFAKSQQAAVLQHGYKVSLATMHSTCSYYRSVQVAIIYTYLKTGNWYSN